MRFTWAGPRNRVARRLVAAVLLAAMVPIGALAFVVYSHMTTQLVEQSERRLHTASRATGLAVLARVQEAERRLRAFAETSLADRPRWIAEHAKDEAKLLLAISGSDGASGRAWLGHGVDAPVVPSAHLDHLAAGNALLTASESGGEAAIHLRLRDPHADGELIASLDPDVIFDISVEDTLPPLGEFCILNDHRRVIRCSLPEVSPGPIAESFRPLRSSARSLEWRHAGVDYFARQWAVFMEPQFGTRAWTIVVAEPQDAALAPVMAFRKSFPLAVLATCLLVAGFVLVQVRRSLAPLDVLRSGTERLAAQDFSEPIPVTGDDEFAVVARSFNDMAGQLHTHLQRLARLIELDRAVLATDVLDDLGETLVRGVLDLHDCEVVAVVAISPDDRTTAFGYAGTRGEETVLRFEEPDFAGLVARIEGSGDDVLAIERGKASAGTLREFAARRMTSARFRRLQREGQPIGILACGYASPLADRAATLPFLDRVADQSAQALGNVYTLEEKRVLAYYDALTGLPNRLMFQERLGQALAHTQRGDPAGVALLMIDLDRFKHVNDTLGHVEGDALLRAVAERLTPRMREGSLARLGGDEFTVIVRDAGGVDAATRVAGTILDLLEDPFVLAGAEHRVSASIGIASHPEDGADAETLLRNADTAMYAAKADGGSAFRLFASDMHERAVERVKLERDLREAVSSDQLRLHYQPVVDLRSGRIVSAEALIRWEHPSLGMMPPDRFIPIAEETEIIHPLGEWVLRRACADNADWQRRGLPRIRIAVNVSGRQLTGAALQTVVKRSLVDHDLYPKFLGLELTETSIMESGEHGSAVLRELSRLGVALSMDDFGTGYSSLAYLRRFPFDHLKIDRSFIQDVEFTPETQAIVRAILAMTRSLGLRTVAEGVETEGQRDWLHEAGCDAAQGYFFSRPIPAESFEKLLMSQGDLE